MANTKISDLSAGAAVSGTDVFPNVQSTGSGPVKTTATQLKTFMSASPTLVTPTLGVATGTTFNGLTITSTSGTITMTNSKTLAVTNTLTLSGTDSTVMTFPSTSATIARTDAANTFTGLQTFSTSVNATTGFGAALTGTGTPGAGKFYSTVTPASNNFCMISDGTNTTINAPGSSGYINLGAQDNWGVFILRAGGISSVGIESVGFYGFGSGTGSAAQTPDTKLTRVGAGIVKIASTGATAGVFVTDPKTVANLPAASTAGQGARSFVTDASTTFILGLGGTVTGGGSNKVPVYSDGTNWIYG